MQTVIYASYSIILSFKDLKKSYSRFNFIDIDVIVHKPMNIYLLVFSHDINQLINLTKMESILTIKYYNKG